MTRKRYELTEYNCQLLETLAGKRGGQVLAGILDDFSEVEKAMDEMGKSAGSADAEMSIVEQSIEYKVNNLKQTWVGLLQNLADRGVIGDTVDSLTSLSEVMSKLISNSHGLSALASTLIGIFTAIKNPNGGISKIKLIPDGICHHAEKLGTGSTEQITDMERKLSYR